MKRRTLQDRFWAKVDRSGDCWIWLGSTKNTHGYGSIWFRDRAVLAHRLSYEWAKGPIPEGLELDHLCCVTQCVNPDHLEAVTHRENMQRHHRKTTHCPRGHPYDGENTYLNRGRRFCRACHLTKQRAKTAAHRSAA